MRARMASNSAARTDGHQPVAPLVSNWSFHMLMTIAIVLLVLWLLGIVTAYTMGGLIHILLVVAVVVVLVRVIQGRSPV
jgi:hypothetical protein